jgi:hypothetical protein
VRRAAASEPIALICEGTRIDQKEGSTEQDVQEKVAGVVQKTKNLVIANYPWKDIERLRSFYEVARATGRKLALSLKQAYLLQQLEGSDAGAPSLDDENIVIYVDRKGWGLITKSDRLAYPDSIVKQDYATWEREFLDLAEAEGVSDFEELNRVLERAVTLKNMLKNRDRVEKVARFVADHFTRNVEPMGYKAFLVGVDREACCFYKEALDRHQPPEYSRVVNSQAGKKDREILKKHYLSEDEEKNVRKAFRDAD